MTDLFENNGAIFSDDRKYRYALWRIWDNTKPLIQFVGLNPSSASEEMDDPTIRRVKRFAKDWGYGGVYMMNLFAIVSTDPTLLLSCPDPLGDNNKWLNEINGRCKTVLFAWGNFPVKGRDIEVMKMFPEAVCLGYNKNGSPKHPLYVAASTKEILFEVKNKNNDESKNNTTPTT